MSLAQSFGAARETYDRFRPPYPDALWEIVDAAQPGRALAIDLGAGNGLATRTLATRFARVIAVEPDVRMAAWSEVPTNVELRVAESEQVLIDDDSVDLVIAAPALHWMDVDVLLPRVARWLRADGAFVAWRYKVPEVDGPVGDVLRAEAVARGDAHRPPRLVEADWTARVVRECAALRVREAGVLRLPVDVDVEMVIGMLGSVSWVRAYAASTADAQAYLAELGDRLRAAASGAVSFAMPIGWVVASRA
jgi:SAM-dependent methyltransferase